MSFLRERLEYPFPSPGPHAGIPLTNGAFAALLWGDGDRLKFTVNRCDYATEDAEAPLPLGRVDLVLPLDWSVASGGLHLATSEAQLELAGYREEGRLRAVMLRDTPVICLRVTGVDGEAVRIESRPPDSPDVLQDFRDRGMPRPEIFDLAEFGGWVQERPGQAAICVAWLRHISTGGLLLFVTSVYGETPSEARRSALQTLEAVSSVGYTPASLRAQSWWRRWWNEGTPLARLEEYRYGGASRGVASSEMSSPISPEAIRLSAADDGAISVHLNGTGSTSVCLRPPWLDGRAITGHMTERQARARALRQKYGL